MLRLSFRLALIALLWVLVGLDLLEPGWGRFYNPLPMLTRAGDCPASDELIAAPGLAELMPFVIQQLRVGSLTATQDARSQWQGVLGEPLCSRQDQGNTVMTWGLPFPESYLQLTLNSDGTVIHYGLFRQSNTQHPGTSASRGVESRPTVPTVGTPAAPEEPGTADSPYRR